MTFVKGIEFLSHPQMHYWLYRRAQEGECDPECIRFRGSWVHIMSQCLNINLNPSKYSVCTNKTISCEIVWSFAFIFNHKISMLSIDDSYILAQNSAMAKHL